MKSEVKKIDASTMELSVNAGADLVKGTFEEVFKKITQQAKIKGFRPGHAPRELIEKEYSHLAHEQVLQELVPQLLDKAFEEHALHVLDTPQIKDVKLERSGLSFKAQVEVSPQIEVKNYRKLAVNYTKAAVTDQEIQRSMDSLKESRKIEALDDAFARSLGYPDLAEFRQVVARQLSVQKDNEQRRQVESQIIDGLVKDIQVKLPQSLVQKQLAELMRQAKMELALRGVAREKIAEEEKKLSAELLPQAQQQVKVYLVLAQIAQKEKIPADDTMTRKVMELLLREAAWNVA